MKKVILFLLLMVLGVQSYAQDYHLILPNQETHFLGKDQEIYSIRIDSFEYFPNVARFKNHDVFFFNYNSNTSCVAIVADSSWLGDKVVLDTSGTEMLFFFYTKEHDLTSGAGVQFVQTIKPLAQLNDTWTYAPIFDGNHLDATVTAVTEETVLGVMDTVKTITLQAKDASNTNIAHAFNGQTIKWSKQHGLIKIFNVFQFPLDSTSFNLVGASNPNRGIVRLTARDIYNYDIGDEFHTVNYGVYPPTSGGVLNTIKTVLTKSLSLNQDTLTYSYERCLTSIEFFPNRDTMVRLDTLVEVHIFSNLTQLDRLSYEVLPDSFGYSIQHIGSSYGSPKRAKVFKTEYIYSPVDECWGLLFGAIYPSFYYEGLGGGYYDAFLASPSSSYYSLVYFNKMNETWGTPLSCDTVTSIALVPNVSEHIQVFPNPFSTSTTIQIEQFDVADDWHLELLDITGKKLLTVSIQDQQFVLHKNNLPTGLYFYRLINNKKQQEYVGKLMIE